MKHKKVYNVFQINLIVFYTICIMMVPMFSVISYIFDFQLYTTTNTIFLIASIIMATVFVIGFVYLLFSRDSLERRLKAAYHREFTIIMVVCALGVLGIGVMFLYIGGQALYVPHVIIPLGIFVFSGLYLLGDHYFNVSLLRRTKR